MPSPRSLHPTKNMSKVSGVYQFETLHVAAKAVNILGNECNVVIDGLPFPCKQ